MPTYEERGLPPRNRTILVVEDSEINRDILVDILADSYTVLQASNGAEGIKLLRDRCDEISLVILDVYMPVMDGMEFLRQRGESERLSNVPTIVVSVSDMVEDEVTSLKLGANDFVRKPYDAEVILNRVSNLISLSESSSMVNQLRWDYLTGLLTEEFFYRRANNLLEAYPSSRFDIIVGDVNDFKGINDRYGRAAGDQVLRDLARALEMAVPGVVASGRVGGDSFALLVEHREDPWTTLLEAAVTKLGAPHVNVRFGVVSNVDHGTDVSTLCDRAASAATAGRGGTCASVVYYDESIREHLRIERMMVSDMRVGLQRGEFQVYYQPKHDVSTGRIAGAESLVRWIHPELGLLRPEVFVRAFERNGLVWELDRFVCEETCREIARLRELGLPEVPISINMSPLDFDEPLMPEVVARFADQYGVDHSLLHIELTETAYMENTDEVVKALERLRNDGFQIELDDFGSGYSSLALLNVLPLDILKIDGGMMRQATRMDDFRLIESAVRIADMLGLKTIVEGVESREALDRLIDMGCDLVQGFYFSWPLRQKSFEEYLAEHAVVNA